MIFPILQALWQQAGPQVLQVFNSPIWSQLMLQIQRNPVIINTLARGANALISNISYTYQSLSSEEKQRMQNAITWVIKDLSGDVVAAATGLPIGPLVNLGVAKVLDDLGHDNPSPEEVSFIRSELFRQLNNH
jgi:hypothetical protein